MNRIFSVLMMVLSLLMGFQQTILVLHFKVNQKAIEQEFCINKSRPERQCHGNCYLIKRLREAESKEQASNTMYQRMDMLPVSIFEFKADSPVVEIGSCVAVYQEGRYKEPWRKIVVPPPI